MPYRRKRILLAACLCAILVLPGRAAALFWQTIKGDHFIINFTDNKDFAQEALLKAEACYSRVSEKLGYARHSDFWTWDKRVEIYIYPDKTSYIQQTGQPEWSNGFADYENKKIIAYTSSRKFLDSILPHEITHLIFRDFVGFKGAVPKWLDEGVAELTDEERLKEIQAKARELYKKNALLTLTDLTTLDFKKSSTSFSVHEILMQDGSLGYLVLNSEDFITVFYVEAASVVGFLKERFGAERFTEFCRQLRDGASIDKSLERAYSQECPDLKTLEEKWRRSLSGAPDAK